MRSSGRAPQLIPFAVARSPRKQLCRWHTCMHACEAMRSPRGSNGHTCARGSTDGANAEASMTQDSAAASRIISWGRIQLNRPGPRSTRIRKSSKTEESCGMAPLARERDSPPLPACMSPSSQMPSTRTIPIPRRRYNSTRRGARSTTFRLCSQTPSRPRCSTSLTRACGAASRGHTPLDCALWPLRVATSSGFAWARS